MLKNSLIIFTLIVNSTLYAKGKLFQDSLDYTQHKNILRSYYKFQSQNDYNLFTGLSDDRGYTVGGGHYFRKVNYSKKQYSSVAITSRLYTDFIPKSKHFVNGKKVYNQRFNEINTATFELSKYNNKHKIFINYSGGLGIQNRQKPIPGFALHFQGGKDGFGGFHQYLFDDLNYNSIPTGNINTFIFIKPAITKYYSISSKLWKKQSPFIKLKIGTTISSGPIENSAFLNLNSEIPLLQFNSLKYRTFYIAGIFNSNNTAHSTGILFNPETGVKISIYNLELKYSVYKQMGKQQTSVIEFYDDEPIMTISIQVNFNNKL